MNDSKRAELFACLGLGVWALLYLVGGADTFQPADSAEFLTVAATGGVAHPPGYPLYTWLGWLATKLWPGQVVTAMSGLAALMTWGTLVGIYLTLRRLGVPWIPAWLGASVTGVSLHVWKHATHPEAFALLGFFAAWICYTAMLATDRDDIGQDKRTRHWLLYAFLVGLASTHHQTIIFTAPIGVLVLWRVFFSDVRVGRRGWVFGAGVVCFLLGLSPYLHLLWRGPLSLPGSWGEIRSWSELLSHILREEFGTFQSGIYKAERPFWFHSWSYLKAALSWRGAFPLGLSLLWLYGFFVSLLAQREKAGDRGFLYALLLSWVLSGLLFPLKLQMGTGLSDQYIAARFFLLPDIFLGIFAGMGIAGLWRLWDGEDEVAAERGRRRLVWMLGALLVGVALFQYPHAASRHRRWIERYTRDLLRELPKGALLLEAHNEAVCFGVVYLQEVVRLRRDVRFVCLPLLARRWYVRRLRRLWPEFKYQWRPKRILSVSVIAAYLRARRPVHVTTLYNRSIQRFFHWEPYGLSWQALPPGMRPRSPQQIERRLRRRFLQMHQQHPLPEPTDAPWPAVLIGRYAVPWKALARVYAHIQRPKDAARCRKIARHWLIQ